MDHKPIKRESRKILSENQSFKKSFKKSYQENRKHLDIIHHHK